MGELSAVTKPGSKGKRLLLLGLAAVLILLTACAGRDQTPPETAVTLPVETASTETPDSLAPETEAGETEALPETEPPDETDPAVTDAEATSTDAPDTAAPETEKEPETSETEAPPDTKPPKETSPVTTAQTAPAEEPITTAPETEKGPEETETMALPEKKKANVILLAGQSNAAGTAFRNYLDTHYTEEYARDRLAQADRGYPNVLIRYSVNPLDPVQGTNENRVFEPVTFGTGYRNVDYRPEWGLPYGPEVGIAEYLTEKYPDETFFIIKCGTSGANLRDRWNPAVTASPTNLAGQMARFVKEVLASLEEEGWDPEIVSFCWMQGESDAQEGFYSVGYRTAFSQLVELVSGLGKTPAAGLSVADAGILSFWPNAQKLNETKKAFSDTSDRYFFIDTSDLDNSRYHEVIGHFDCYATIVLGRRFGECVSAALENRLPSWPAFPG